MAIYEITINKKKGENIIPDVVKIINEKLNGDPAFLELITDPVPNKGVNDDGKPYIVLIGQNSAIVILRQNDKKVLVSFIKTPMGLRHIDDELRNRYKIFLFKGRTSPYEFDIKQHIIELLAEEPDMDEEEGKDESDIKEDEDESDKEDKREKKEFERDESDEEWERVFNPTKGT